MGIDPTTHKPKVDAHVSAGSSHSNLSHMAQWESARLEAEARLVRESKFQLGSSSFPSAQPARLVLNKISARPSVPPCLDVLKAWQNSWSLSTTQDKNTRMHNMYALMLAATDDNLESPTSTLSFPEPILPPISSNVVLPVGENSLIPAATTVNSATASSTVESWGGLTVDNSDKEIGERRLTSLQDDDIMVAVEAFIAERYKNGPEALSCNTVIEGLNSNDSDVLVYESNENIAGGENSGFMDINGSGSMICSNVNFEEKNHYWNSIYSFQLGD